MKKVKFFICLTGGLWLISLSLAGQTHIFLDDHFMASSVEMASKRKGIGAIGKYEFGPYRIISGKGGLTSTKSKTGLISNDTRTESKSKSSFVFTGEGMDTITANILVTSVVQIDEQLGFAFRVLTNWSIQEVTENQEVYMATYSFSSDTGVWNMVLTYPATNEAEGETVINMNSPFQGILANSQTTIDIVPEYRWENGRLATIFNPVEGYIFSLQGETVAAVQVFPYNKMFVWIKKDLPDDFKFILAAGAATIMVRKH
jgi:hypothetical protein